MNITPNYQLNLIQKTPVNFQGKERAVADKIATEASKCVLPAAATLAVMAGVKAADIKEKIKPSQEYPKYNQDAPTEKLKAEMRIFGNASLDEANPEAVDKAVSKLSEMYGREISREDIRVVRSRRNAEPMGNYYSLNYFDSETNILTVFNEHGELWGQRRIMFDSDGKVLGYDKNFGIYGSLTPYDKDFQMVIRQYSPDEYYQC